MDPQNYTASETLKDGTPVTIRAIRHDDGNTILNAFKNLDRESVYRRFFSPKKDLTDAELEQLTDVDFSQVVALVVTTQGRGGRNSDWRRTLRARRNRLGWRRDRLYDRQQLSGLWYRVSHLETSRANRSRSRLIAVRGGCARGKSAHACCLSAQRLADATSPGRWCPTRDAYASTGFKHLMDWGQVITLCGLSPICGGPRQTPRSNDI